ncbi:hypothetical protein [uncultured Brachyspira sp.]|uniref:hypothetical protein n=1 Tax=uncultured Brachyspira sp. TaxID=221953 RepID=UPI00258B7574|nr:hypothetical protein [uncultured Brachyspira sp.]
MELNIKDKNKYFEAVKSLYPEGLFFETQFENENSDMSKLAKCQSDMIYNIKLELKKLWLEARLETCTEDTIADYERIHSKEIRTDLSLEKRKMLILQNDILTSQNPKELINNLIENDYKMKILNINANHKISVFGNASFGHTRLWNYRAFCTIVIKLTQIEDVDKKSDNIKELEDFITSLFDANKIIFFEYV